MQYVRVDRKINRVDIHVYKITGFLVRRIDKISHTWYAADSGLKRALLFNLAQLSIFKKAKKILQIKIHSSIRFSYASDVMLA